MFVFKALGDSSVLTGIISKNIFDAISEGKKTIVNHRGKEEKIDGIKFFNENGPHIKYEGRKNFIEVGFFPCENQDHKEIGPSEIFISKKDLSGIKRDSFFSNIIDIFDQDYLKLFGKYIPEQFIKMIIKPIEQEGNLWVVDI